MSLDVVDELVCAVAAVDAGVVVLSLLRVSLDVVDELF